MEEKRSHASFLLEKVIKIVVNFGSSLLQIKCKTILLVQGLDFDQTLGYSSDGQVHTVKPWKRI